MEVDEYFGDRFILLYNDVRLGADLLIGVEVC
jgi:hypothetical protein